MIVIGHVLYFTYNIMYVYKYIVRIRCRIYINIMIIELYNIHLYYIAMHEDILSHVYCTISYYNCAHGNYNDDNTYII